MAQVSELPGPSVTHNDVAAILQRKVNTEDGGKEDQVFVWSRFRRFSQD